MVMSFIISLPNNSYMRVKAAIPASMRGPMSFVETRRDAKAVEDTFSRSMAIMTCFQGDTYNVVKKPIHMTLSTLYTENFEIAPIKI
jgi:hypothetical protein